MTPMRNTAGRDNARVPLNTSFIKARRLKLRLTQAQAAKLAGMVNAQKWCGYENGTLTNPQLDTIHGIARALHCKASKLVTD